MVAVFFNIQIKDESRVEGLDWLPILGLSIFVVMFYLGIGTITWILMGELFAPDIRGIAAAIGTTTNFLLSFVVSFTFPIMQDAMGVDGPFWIFVGFSFLGVIFVFFFIPETKGIPLEDIQKIFYDRRIFMFKKNI